MKKTIILFAALFSVLMTAHAEVIPVKLKNIRASSTLEAKYSADKIADGEWTGWVEGAKGEGIGEYFEADFAEPSQISYLCIKNGFGNLAYYWTNNRVKEAEIRLDDNKAFTIHLEDTPVSQDIYLPASEKKYSKIRFTIKEIYKGTDPDNDTCISEVCVNSSIDRRRYYGAIYSTPETAFKYDPETKRMLKGLYELDVGKNSVKETDGIVYVQDTDWEMGNKFWVRPNFSLRGRLFHDFYPGTGGGHHSYQYKILLNPDGRHLLFTWYEQFYGYRESYDPKVHVYVWEEKKWKDISSAWNEKRIESVHNFIKNLEKRNIEYTFNITEGESSSTEVIELGINFRGRSDFFIKVCFPYKNYTFSDYSRDILTICAFGKPEDFNIKSGFNENLSQALTKISPSPLAVAAAFNPDPQMCRYLIDLGLKTDDKNPCTALEAWNIGSNNEKVSDLLLKNGAEYSVQMLTDAVSKDDRKRFASLCPHIKEFSEVIRKLADSSLPSSSLLFYYKTLKDNGVDLNKTLDFGDRYVHHYYTPMNSAVRSLDINYVKGMLALGCTIPEYDDYENTPAEYLAKTYIDSCKSRDYYKDDDSQYFRKASKDAEDSLKMLNYLFSIGVRPESSKDSDENILHHIARNANHMDRYYLEMAELFISRGVSVNRISDYGTPLYLLIKESYNKESSWNEWQKAFKKLLLDNGAIPEYALISMLKKIRSDALLEKDSELNRQFEFYLSLCHGKAVWTDSRDHPERNKNKSIPIHYLEQEYSSDDPSSDEMLIRLLDAGFGVEGKIDYNGEKDPFIYYADEINKWRLEGIKLDIADRLLKLSPEGSVLRDKILYLLIKDRMGWDIDRCFFTAVKFLCDRGASWKYKVDEKINGKKVSNTAELLLAGGEYLWCLDYEYIQDDYEKDDFVFVYDETKLTPEELIALDNYASPYIEAARLFISQGAASVLTEKAFKKAGVPERVYRRILKD